MTHRSLAVDGAWRLPSKELSMGRRERSKWRNMTGTTAARRARPAPTVMSHVDRMRP